MYKTKAPFFFVIKNVTRIQFAWENRTSESFVLITKERYKEHVKLSKLHTDAVKPRTRKLCSDNCYILTDYVILSDLRLS